MIIRFRLNFLLTFLSVATTLVTLFESLCIFGDALSSSYSITSDKWPFAGDAISLEASYCGVSSKVKFFFFQAAIN